MKISNEIIDSFKNGSSLNFLIMFTDFGKKPLLENWLPWQQRNVYLQLLNFKTFLMPSFEKSPSFKVIACSVLEF